MEPCAQDPKVWSTRSNDLQRPRDRELPPILTCGSKSPCDSRGGCTDRPTGRSWPSCATGSHSIVGAGLERDDAQEHGLGEPAGVVEIRHRLGRIAGLDGVDPFVEMARRARQGRLGLGDVLELVLGQQRVLGAVVVLRSKNEPFSPTRSSPLPAAFSPWRCSL